MQNTMTMQDNTAPGPTPSILNMFRCKCPRCRKGDMFIVKNPYQLRTTMKMREECELCGQAFDIEPGFYYGSSYVSYALGIAISVAFLVLFIFTVGISLNDNRFFYWMAANAVLLILLQPPMMRVARSVWLAFFVRYNPRWRSEPAKKPERVNEDQKNNW